jgi:Arc/MetJ-type ribon-helix-helix transcriptional regulator
MMGAILDLGRLSRRSHPQDSELTPERLQWQSLTRPAIELPLFMKAVTINISLNPELAEFARADSEARAFDSMSEYMGDLIRHRRQEQINQDVAMLEKGMENAPPGDPSDEEMAEIVKTQHRLRAKRRKSVRRNCPAAWQNRTKSPQI